MYGYLLDLSVKQNTEKSAILQHQSLKNDIIVGQLLALEIYNRRVLQQMLVFSVA